MIFNFKDMKNKEEEIIIISDPSDEQESITREIRVLENIHSWLFCTAVVFYSGLAAFIIGYKLIEMVKL